MRIKIYRGFRSKTAYLVLPAEDSAITPQALVKDFGQAIEPPLCETIHAWENSGRIDVKAAYRAVKRYGYFIGNILRNPTRRPSAGEGPVAAKLGKSKTT